MQAPGIAVLLTGLPAPAVERLFAVSEQGTAWTI
jgi:hypothetical protein